MTKAKTDVRAVASNNGRKRVYVAGPMSKGDPVQNLANGMKAFRELAEQGFSPFVPHLQFFMEPFFKADHRTWLDMDFPWVSVCDFVLRIPGESPGADEEVALAKSLGIPVATTINDLVAWRRIMEMPPSTQNGRQPVQPQNYPVGCTD